MPLVSSFLLPRHAFSPSCPSGGTFYACQSGTNFVGCCNSEACSNGCSDGNLEPANFNTAYYGQFKDQECPTGSRWYTCTGTKPPFMGCCKSNPCSNDGCPAGDLTAGFLSSNPKVAADFLPSGAASSSTSSLTSSESSTSTSASHTSSTVSTTSSVSFSTASSAAAAATYAVTAQASAIAAPVASQHSSTETIAGASVGGVGATLVLLALLAFFIRRKTNNSRQHMAFSRAGIWGSGTETVVGGDSAAATEKRPDASPLPP